MGPPHTFRKIVATLIKKERDIKSAAAQLGHASEEVTDTYYIAKPVLAPDVCDILERLGADQGPSNGAARQASRRIRSPSVSSDHRVDGPYGRRGSAITATRQTQGLSSIQR